jgi:hypothetical protein
MTPGRFDLKLYRGDSYAWQFTLWEDDAQTIPVDLTGFEVAAEIRNESAGTVYATLGTTITGTNTIEMKLSAVQCQACPAKGVWDLQLTDPAPTPPEVRTVVVGLVLTLPDVTDSVPAPAAAIRR